MNKITTIWHGNSTILEGDVESHRGANKWVTRIVVEGNNVELMMVVFGYGDGLLTCTEERFDAINMENSVRVKNEVFDGDVVLDLFDDLIRT
jgi:hypothetical protein